MKNNVDVAKIMEEILQEVEEQYGAGYEGSLSQTLSKKSEELTPLVKRIHALDGIHLRIPPYADKKPFAAKLMTMISRVTSKLTRFINFQQNEINSKVATSLNILQESSDEIALWSKEMEARMSMLEKNMSSLLQGGNDRPAPAGKSFDGQTYLAFEEQYRGDQEEIRRRQQQYLHYVKNWLEEDLQGDIIDLGCGRGEWLDILQADGYYATGIDLNEKSLEECRRKKLHVLQGDAITYLKTLPDKSVRLLTSFQLIEHLELESLLILFRELGRVVKKGGLIIMETPNPCNLQVGAASFYLDPTHVRQLHPEFVRFLAAQSGFERIEVVYPEQDKAEQWWNSVIREETTDIQESACFQAIVNELRRTIWSSADYAVIAKK
ncbi:MAG: class I SAM-dependent methyltransferase [Lachnospiraceae bacterium]|nr:class I SAM-dependent methyltransferase [Lachnospiraceae bacterium]